MSIKSDFFQNTIKSAFDIKRFVSFSNEFFNNLTIIRPNKFMEDGWNWSEFSFYIKGYYHIANFSGSDKSKIAVFAVEMKSYRSIDKSRSIQRNFIKKLLVSGGMDAGIIAFYSPEEPKWRLSFIKIDYEFAKGKVTEKLTPVKRYSYLVGDGEPCHTAMERLYPIFMHEITNPTISEIEDAFSVEKVTKEFFEKYKEKYLQIKDHLDCNEDFITEAERLHFTSEQFAKKLMGQLAFLYFIQKKGWLGVNAFPKKLNASEFKKAFYRQGKASREVIPKAYKQISENEYIRIGSAIEQLSVEDQEVLAASVNGQPWGTGPKNFIRELFRVCSNKGANFFDDYLEPLFYEALNEKRGANDYYAKLKCRVPFLNGGLFEAIDNYDWNRNDFQISNEMFSNIDAKGEEKADGVLDIFDRYNFTMNEDEPLEKEVAVDPEMLGKIFENLLDVRDRKSKGAFYTPREIVHYMCQESLANYLTNATGISYDAIKDLIMYGEFYKDEDTNHLVKEGYEDTVISKEIFDKKNNTNRLTEIDDALVNIRVVDPAVGSGAFPLGMLSEIVKLRRIITEYFVMLTDNKMQIKMLYESERHPLVLKLQTIKNSIFAVDIDSTAVDITKLRLWLSLVVEQETDENAEDEGIFATTKNPRPLPNLDCNIRCGNSLIDELDGIKLVNDSDLFGTSEGQVIINQGKYDSLLEKLFESKDKLFYEKSHYVKDELKRKINIIIDSIVRFNLENAKPEIISKYESIKDKHPQPYFLWKLEFAKVFKEKGGFDIVIGNPPYLKELSHKHIFEDVMKTEFGKLYSEGKMNYWYFFAYKGFEALKQGGHLCFIAPNYYLNGTGAKKLNTFITQHTRIKTFIDFNKTKVFESADVQCMIILSQNNSYTDNDVKEEGKVYLLRGRHHTDEVAELMKNLDTSHYFRRLYLSDQNKIISKDGKINFDSLIYQELLNKINSNKSHKRLFKATQGIVENPSVLSKKSIEMLIEKGKINITDYGTKYFDGQEVFVLSKSTINTLQLEDKEKEFLREYHEPNHINKYEYERDTQKYLLYLNKSNIEDIELYPSLKRHLIKFKPFMAIRRETLKGSNQWFHLHWPRKEEIFINEKILFPQMTEIPKFAYCNEPYFINMSSNLIFKENESIELLALTGILNSKLAHFWLLHNAKNRGIGLDISVSAIDRFPASHEMISKNSDIIEDVKKIIQLASKNKNYEENEKTLNDKVYQLYSITVEEQEMIDNYINERTVN